MQATMTDPWQAMADPTRRAVFARVVAGPCSVTEIARELPVSRPAVSQHLQILLGARLVDVRQQGRERRYQPRPDGLEQLRRELESFWTQTMTRFKDLAEQTYQASTSSRASTHALNPTPHNPTPKG